MKRYLASIILFGMMTVPALAGPSSLATARLTIDEATCSGTVVAPNVILSAEHCFKAPPAEFPFIELPEKPLPTTMLVDGYKVYILGIVFDENDHALVKVNIFFHAGAVLAKPPEVGTHVHYWGNPAGVNNVYREGYVSNYLHGEMVLDVNGFFGDSGAGIFNPDGKVVGVMSYLHALKHNGQTFKLMGVEPLEFTPLQYDMMGVTAP